MTDQQTAGRESVQDIAFDEGAEAEVQRVTQACARQGNEVEQILGKALGYPPLYPEASEVDDGQVGVGEHTPETIAAETADKIADIERRLSAERAAREAAENKLSEVSGIASLSGLTLAEKLAAVTAERDKLRVQCERLKAVLVLLDDRLKETGFSRTGESRTAIAAALADESEVKDG